MKPRPERPPMEAFIDHSFLRTVADDSRGHLNASTHSVALPGFPPPVGASIGYPQIAQWSVATMSWLYRFYTRHERSPRTCALCKQLRALRSVRSVPASVSVTKSPLPLLFPRIVGGVHIGDALRAHAVQLESSVLGEPCVVRHPLAYKGIPAGFDERPLPY